MAAIPLAALNQRTSDEEGGIEDIIEEIVSGEIVWDTGIFPCAMCTEPAVRALGRLDIAPRPWMFLYLCVPTCEGCGDKATSFSLPGMTSTVPGRPRRNTYRMSSWKTRLRTLNAFAARNWPKVTAVMYEGLERKVAIERNSFVYFPERIQPADFSDSLNVRKVLQGAIDKAEQQARDDWEAKHGFEFQLRCVGCDKPATMEFFYAGAKINPSGPVFRCSIFTPYAAVCSVDRKSCSRKGMEFATEIGSAIEGDPREKSRNRLVCNNCGKSEDPNGEPIKLKRCSNCLLAIYCSSECQNAAWTEHKPLCRLPDSVQKVRRPAAK